MPPFADVLQWEHLPFPKSLRDFQRLFPDDAACARYLEGAKGGDWTGWEDRRYGGDTLLGALNAAWLECMQWRTALQYGREKHGPTPTAMFDNKEDADEATDNGHPGGNTNV